MRYIKAFIIAAPIMALLAHWLAEKPMPLWPDTVVFGGFMGALAAFAVLRLTFVARALRPVLGAGRALLGRARR